MAVTSDAKIERDRETRRIARGEVCRDCGTVCTSIEECVRRISWDIVKNRRRVTAPPKWDK